MFKNESSDIYKLSPYKELQLTIISCVDESDDYSQLIDDSFGIHDTLSGRHECLREVENLTCWWR